MQFSFTADALGTEPMVMAGLWESWNGPDGEVVSCTICTTDANPFMMDFHDRMPVILPDAMIAPWLDPSIKDPVALKPCHYRHFFVIAR